MAQTGVFQNMENKSLRNYITQKNENPIPNSQSIIEIHIKLIPLVIFG